MGHPPWWKDEGSKAAEQDTGVERFRFGVRPWFSRVESRRVDSSAAA
jgi:hypothetical protein